VEQSSCRVAGCPKFRRYPNIDLCNAHYLRKQRYGDPLGAAPPRPTTRERFDSKVVKATSGCWEWTGAHFQATGYAVFTMRSSDGKWRPYTGHSIAYRLYVGDVPDGMWLDHLCRNRGCVNPAHLEPVTPQDNVLRGYSPAPVSVRANRCHRGHEFTPENTYTKTKPNGRTKRECRQCQRMREQRRPTRRR
jgi:hypothetical protein